MAPGRGLHSIHAALQSPSSSSFSSPRRASTYEPSASRSVWLAQPRATPTASSSSASPARKRLLGSDDAEASWGLALAGGFSHLRTRAPGCRAQAHQSHDASQVPTQGTTQEDDTAQSLSSAVTVLARPNLLTAVAAGPATVSPGSVDALAISGPGISSLVSGRRTGGSIGYRGATAPLVPEQLLEEKHIVLVRHGLSSWNEEGRVQGSSDASVLSPQGELQAVRCREALQFIDFDCCFASPISRARTTAEIMWEERQGPLLYLDSLREANLLFLEGMLNSDAKAQYPQEYRAWREDPANFSVDGVFPVRRLWDQAREAWRAILSDKGHTVLIVTHKSLLRALLCTALGMGPERFRAVDINNGGVCVMKVSRKGEPMVDSLNLTAHLQCESVHYSL